jgi:tetratricopeptide (TPR) repeat protein
MKLCFAFLMLFAAQDPSQVAAEHMRAGRYNEAVVLYRQLAKTQPTLLQWKMNLGLALHSAGELAEAVEVLTKFLQQKQGTTPELRAKLSRVVGVDLLQLRRACEAVPWLTQSTDGAKALAQAQYDCGDYAAAAKLFMQVGQRREAARAWWRGASYSAALLLYEELRGLHGHEPDFRYEYGDTLLRLERADEARGQLEAARELAPARAALGRAYVRLQRWAEAIPLLEEAAQQDASLYLPLANALRGAGRAEEAAQAMQRFRQQQK